MKMHLSLFVLALLFCIHEILTWAWTCGSWFPDNEVEGIASRWLNAFATEGLPGLDEAVARNVHPAQ